MIVLPALLTRADGRTRVIFFRTGKAIGPDTGEAVPGDCSAAREGA